MKFKNIVGYHNLWIYLGEEVKDIDLNTSMIMQGHHFALKGGETVYTASYNQTLDILNERFDTKFCSELSKFVGQTHFTIAIKEDSDEVIESEDKVEPEVEELAENDGSKEEQEEVEVEESTEKQPDWAWIEGLENNKEDKLELDKYAEEEFDIKLKRTKKISGMIEDFKAALETK